MSNEIIFSATYKNTNTNHTFNFEVFEDETILAVGSAFNHMALNGLTEEVMGKLETLRGEPYLSWVCIDYTES